LSRVGTGLAQGRRTIFEASAGCAHYLESI